MTLSYRKEKCYVCSGSGNHKIIYTSMMMIPQNEPFVDYEICWQCGGSGKIELLE